MVKTELFMSTVAGNLQVKKDQQAIKNLLEAKKIEYVEYDVASDLEKREYMKKVSGKTVLPQLFINGKFAGTVEELLDLEEDNKFIELFK
ncbi:thioredoxin domain-containing protein [Dictyostelium discoideum AX4]|uniref:Thioredoxin domain-containing protein n=1 Tax=Dictyostelium discoideum TaxID=44689 RepID=Q54XE7_DICDI|nr:thioredoxin domain-containing protein [Dictyostelium discoideum AX4]EAL67927.1 thioredoxin domain-containing protein [Dictyostelium discoideum AX4]|eukprot:XP_641904.1 thioredoxin domain-containing protein [Dictyostelium discoideum AX4]